MAQAPRIPKARSPSPPRRPPVGSSPRKGGGGGGAGFFVFIMIAAALGGAYYITHRPAKVAEAPTVATVPAPVALPKQEAPQVIELPKPEMKPTVTEAPSPKPKAEQPAPIVKKTEPMPTPAPAPAPNEEPVMAGVFDGVMPLDDRAGNTPEALKRAKAAARAAMDGGKWSEWSGLLRRSLTAAIKAGGPPALTPPGLQAMMKSEPFTKALEQVAFLDTLTPAAQQLIAAGREDEFYLWLLTSPYALQSWLLTVRTDYDDVAGALGMWKALAGIDPEAKGKYSDLALACSLVYEKPLKGRWNNDYLTITAEERYAYYTKHAAKGDLVIKPDKLTARDLIWTVSAPVPESEMEWALQKMHLRQKNWGTSYDTVKYDMERAVKGTDKYDGYTFSEILKKGGICGDRAYFAANTARAVGIPAATISGDGSRGGHAWMAWLSEEDKWDFDGRYAGYPLGRSPNPQTGKSESEQFFIRRTGRAASDAAMLAGLRPVWLARMAEAQEDLGLAGQLFDVASVLGEKVPEVWHAKLVFWSAHRGDAPLDQWRTFLDALKRQMKADPDLLAEARTAEEKFVFPRQDTKLAMKELKKDARKLDQADSKTTVDQANQIAKVIKEEAEVLKLKGQLDPIRSLYEKSYREHGRNPAVFKVLANDCWAFVKDSPEVGKKACRDMESAFRRYINQGGDYFDITSQMSALKLISRCYRELGEEKKAESLAKDVEKANSKAGKQAL